MLKIPLEPTVCLAINGILSILLISVLLCELHMLRKRKRVAFLTAIVHLVNTRKHIKSNVFRLNEFLSVCKILDISREEVTNMYGEMHRDRRETGEHYLFDEAEEGGEDRRKLALFKRFASSSQFTQGRIGYRLHYHLHRPASYQGRYAPEAKTMFDISHLQRSFEDADPVV